MKKADRIKKAKKELERVLKTSRFVEIKAKHGKVNPNTFPDLRSAITPYKSLGNGFGKTPGKKQLPADAKQFPVGNDHKSGLRLIIATDKLEYMAGKKT